jgi:hypothetical protein
MLTATEDKTMEGAMKGWQRTTWAQWLGWTLVFEFLFAGATLPFSYHVPERTMTGYLLLV